MTLDIVLGHVQEQVKTLFIMANFCNSDNVAGNNPLSNSNIKHCLQEVSPASHNIHAPEK